MRASSCLSLLEGISTSSWAAMIPLRIRVRKSAMGSVIDMRSPARLRHAGDEAVVRQLSQAHAAEAELAVDGARSPAAPAARVGPRLVLRRARLAHDLGLLCHGLLVPRPRRAPAQGSRTQPGGPPARRACPARRAARTPRRRWRRMS